MNKTKMLTAAAVCTALVLVSEPTDPTDSVEHALPRPQTIRPLVAMRLPVFLAATTTTAPPAPTTTMPPPPTTSPEAVPEPEPEVVPETTTTHAHPPAPAPSTEAVQEDASDGDQVWHDLAECESGGDWRINTGNNFYGGLQFSRQSWQAVGGTGLPHEHSVGTQIEMGRRLQAIQGWNAWPSCSRQLGLR